MIGFHLGVSTTLDFIVGRIPVVVLSANGGQIIVTLFEIGLPLLCRLTGPLPMNEVVSVFYNDDFILFQHR